MSVVDTPLHPGIEDHRRELTGYCYRMLGAGSEAEDAAQEAIVRAWRRIDDLEDPAALRAWLYRIATNVCLDMLKSAQRRARPMDLGPASTAGPKLTNSSMTTASSARRTTAILRIRRGQGEEGGSSMSDGGGQ